MEPVRLIVGTYGQMETPWEVASPLYQRAMEEWGEGGIPQLCCARIHGDPCTLNSETDDDSRFTILFGLFETGQVDYKRYRREFILPSGETIEV